MESCEWIGGELCLDFVNTANWTAQGEGKDKLADYADLVSWAAQSALLADARPLLGRATLEPERAARSLREARRLRRTLHVIFESVARGAPPSTDALESFNRSLGRALAHLQLRSAGSSFDWSWSMAENDLGRILPPVLWSAARLLSSSELAHVKVCPSDSCGWLFVDRSRRHNRRWCQMKDCGSRDKARRYYHRHRSHNH